MTNASEFSEQGIAEYLFGLSSQDHAAAAGNRSIIDTSTRISKNVAACLKQNGVETVAKYYSRTASTSSKVLTKAEADLLINNGLRLAIFHENDAQRSSFSHAAGLLDGKYTCDYALSKIGQPRNSAIYFAVDFDYLPNDPVLQQRIIPYFKGVAEAVQAAGTPYRIGVYGSGLTCKAILDQGLASLAWLAQSTGWGGYQQFKNSKRWAVLQHGGATLCGIGVDFDEPNPDIPDFGSFDRLTPAAPMADEAMTAEAMTAEAMTAEAEGGAPEASVSSTVLDGLDPDLKARVLILLDKCRSKGVKMVPYFGLRDPLTQAKLWRQSRSAAEAADAVAKLRGNGATFLAGILEQAETLPGQHVTNALPGLSWHQWGEALDCYWEVGGKPEWNPDRAVNGVKGYHVYADLAGSTDVGLTAGGHWSSFKDWPHVQLRSAGSPKDVFSWSYIDTTMRERFGHKPAIAGSFVEAVPAAASDDAGHGTLADAFKSVLDGLREASGTTVGNKPYFFPDGIFKIDVVLGTPSGPGGDETASSLISARVTVSGIDKP